MANEPSPTTPNVPDADLQTPPEPQGQSIREAMEAAYDSSTGTDPQKTPEDTGQDGRARDSLGRFAAKEAEKPGEQSVEPAQVPDPALKPDIETQPKAPDPAPSGSSNQPPEHWSAEHKALFAKQPEDVRKFLSERYGEMEADYTRKSQAAAGAVNFANALAPVFNDPVIAANLRERQTHPVQVIQEWGDYHRRGLSQNPRERIGALVEIAERMGFDPAVLFGAKNRPPAPGLSEKELQDPSVKYFADQFGRTTNELRAVQTELQRLRQASAEEREKERQQQALNAAEARINDFAEAKDASGNLLRPKFDTVIPQLKILLSNNPGLDMQEAYETALGMSKTTRAELIAAEVAKARAAEGANRAKAAVRGNVRGLTSAVNKPTPANGAATSLRSVIEASAEEVGL